jgi:DNA-binding NtrC family response regulator
MSIVPLQATILVVIDDEAVTRTFERVLSHQGYRVFVALNAEDALRAVSTASACCIASALVTRSNTCRRWS